MPSHRSKEAPMDYEWTNRDSTKPVWATPRKPGPHEDASQSSVFGTPRSPTFGSNQNVPFIFQSTPIPPTPHSHPWAPPPQFSPAKVFPTQEDLKDVDMSEVSPDKPEEQDRGRGRPIAMGGLRRIYNQRNRPHPNRARARQDDDELIDASDEEDDNSLGPLTQNTSNHYTLNLPSPPPPPSDMPYILLGYLQFFFNFSLILIFFYLVVQFILTVQRDVEHRISEYSQDIVQEIAMCALHYRNNLCDKPLPAMAQQCNNWETCMLRDPTVVGRARVGAELIAEVVNSFVEPISWKTLIFALTSSAFLTVFINALLSLYRSRHHPGPIVAPHAPQPFPIAPATPFPSHHFGGYLSPAPTPGWGRHRSDQDLESPTRRRRLEGNESAKVK